MSKKVLVPIAQGTEEMEAVIIIDMLRRAGVKVIVAGANNIITCSRGVKIIPDKYFSDIDADDTFDAIVIPGGKEGTEILCDNESFQDILKHHNKREGLIGAICAAPTILSDLKLLKADTKVTSHPSVRAVFNPNNYSGNSVVISDRFITSRGAGTAFDFALQLIETLTDSDMADKIKNDIVL